LEGSFAYICEYGAKELDFIALRQLTSKINKLKDISIFSLKITGQQISVDVGVFAYEVASS